MMLKEPVSDSVVRRLPRYYRYLSELERARFQICNQATGVFLILDFNISQ